MDKIILKKPVLINGQNITELTYDTEEIDGVLYTQAEHHKIKTAGQGGNLAGAIEIDYSQHLYIGYAAIIAVNPEYTFEDLERIKGSSLRDIARIGRSFFIESAKLQAENSDEQSGTTLELITPASTTWNENE